MNDFDTDAAYAIAERMLDSAIARGKTFYRLSDMDREDVIQEAVAEQVQAWLRTGRQDAGYMAGAARQAIWRWIVRQWYGRSSPRPGHTVDLDAGCDDGDVREIAAPEPSAADHGVSEAVTAAVWRRLYAERGKQGARGEAATDRDVTILHLVTRGYSNAAIAQELALPLDSVKTYRARTRARMRAWLKEQT